MWRRRKAQIAELDEKLAALDVKLEQLKGATSELSRTAVVAATTDKVLKHTIRRAESMNAVLKKTAQGR